LKGKHTVKEHRKAVVGPAAPNLIRIHKREVSWRMQLGEEHKKVKGNQKQEKETS